MERPEEKTIELSFKDQLVLRIIWELSLNNNGLPPTNREILSELKKTKEKLPKEVLDQIRIGSNSTSVIDGSLKNLNNNGFIKVTPKLSRGIKILKESILPPIIPPLELEK